MSKIVSLIQRTKVFVLTCLTIISFIFSSIGWRHVDSTEETRVLVAATILIILYALIVFELINRNLAALIGAGLSVAAHDCLVEFVSLEQLIDWLDLETLSLLFGMMIIVGVLGDSGLFDYLAIWSYKQSRGHFWLLIAAITFITATLSALVDNVSTMLLISPTLIRLSELEHLDPRYVLMMMVIVSNIGGCATPVGDPPNLIIIGNDLVGSLHINFGSFTAYCTPGVILTIASLLVYLKLRYGSKESFGMARGKPEAPPTELDCHHVSLNLELEALDLFGHKLDTLGEPLSEPTLKLKDELQRQATNLRGQVQLVARSAGHLAKGVAESNSNDKQSLEVQSRLNEEEIEQLMQTHGIKDRQTLYESLTVLGAAILLFFLQSIPGIQLTLGWTSLFSGLVLLVLDSRKGHQSFEQTIAKIEWGTLIFFSGLFITMEAMGRLGLIGWLGGQVMALMELLPEGQVRLIGSITIILWASALASTCIDNVPFSSMMIKILASMIEADQRRARQVPDAASSRTSSMRALVFALAFGASFGGNGSLIGASANLVTAGVSGRLGYPITFNGFFKFAAPMALLSLLVSNLYLVALFVWLDL